MKIRWRKWWYPRFQAERFVVVAFCRDGYFFGCRYYYCFHAAAQLSARIYEQ